MGRTPTRSRNHAGPLAVAFMAVLALAGCTKIEAGDLIREGNKLYDAGKFAEAIEAYDAAEQLTPEEPTLFWNRACAAEAQVLRMKDPAEREERKAYADRALRDFQVWYDRTEPKTEDDRATVHDHRLALLKADERCDDLLTYWLEKHRSDPKDERLYSKVAQQYDECGQREKYFEWLEKRTQDFPESVQAWHTLATLKFLTIMPGAEDTRGYVESIPREERLRIADEVIALLDQVTKLDEKFADAFRWRAMAYTQKQLAREVVEAPETPEERLEAVLAREDNLLAWKQQRAVCDLESRPECPATILPETPPCCPPSPFTAEEQAQDAQLKAEILQELAAQAEAATSGSQRGAKRKKRGKGK